MGKGAEKKQEKTSFLSAVQLSWKHLRWLGERVREELQSDGVDIGSDVSVIAGKDIGLLIRKGLSAFDRLKAVREGRGSIQPDVQALGAAFGGAVPREVAWLWDLMRTVTRNGDTAGLPGLPELVTGLNEALALKALPAYEPEPVLLYLLDAVTAVCVRTSFFAALARAQKTAVKEYPDGMRRDVYVPRFPKAAEISDKVHPIHPYYWPFGEGRHPADEEKLSSRIRLKSSPAGQALLEKVAHLAGLEGLDIETARARLKLRTEIVLGTTLAPRTFTNVVKMLTTPSWDGYINSSTVHLLTILYLGERWEKAIAPHKDNEKMVWRQKEGGRAIAMPSANVPVVFREHPFHSSSTFTPKVVEICSPVEELTVTGLDFRVEGELDVLLHVDGLQKLNIVFLHPESDGMETIAMWRLGGTRKKVGEWIEASIRNCLEMHRRLLLPNAPKIELNVTLAYSPVTRGYLATDDDEVRRSFVLPEWEYCTGGDSCIQEISNSSGTLKNFMGRVREVIREGQSLKEFVRLNPTYRRAYEEIWGDAHHLL